MIASLLFLTTACGSGNESNSISTASDTGSISFTLKWQNSQLNTYEIQSPSGDVCTDYFIQTVNAEVFDSSDVSLVKASWDCTAHQGTIPGVPVGEDYTVSIEGIVTGNSDNADWQALITEISVIEDQNTDIGTVEMIYIGVYPAEVVALIDSQLHRFYRGSPPQNSDWADGGVISEVSDAAGNPALIQSNFGNKGNFELVYPSSDVEGGIIHILRDNDYDDLPWVFTKRIGTAGAAIVDAVTIIQSDTADGF